MRKGYTILPLIILVLMIGSCEITLAHPAPEFFLIKTWRLVKVKEGEITERTNNLEKFRMTFYEDGALDYTEENGEVFEGDWSLNSSGSVINTNLTSKDNVGVVIEERWTIIELGLRRLRLVRELGDNKDGKYTRTYFLEAVPQ